LIVAHDGGVRVKTFAAWSRWQQQQP